MLLKFTRDLVTRSGRRFRADRTYELTDGEGKILIRRGYAKRARARQTKRGKVGADNRPDRSADPDGQNG